MNKITYTITDNQIKFDRLSIIKTIKNWLAKNTEPATQEEKSLLLETVLNKIETFEKKLSSSFKIYLDYEKEIDKNYVNDIILNMQTKVNYFISICVQQEFRHLIH